MQKLNFEKRETNFWLCRKFAKSQNYSDYFLLSQAFEQNVLNDENNELLKKFIKFLKNKKNYQIYSQLYQDMFAEFVTGDEVNKTFLEFGATDGINLSNSYSLEKFSNWKGVIAEPDPQWHKRLKSNRPDSTIIYDCIWTKSNEKLEFISSYYGELSTLEKYRFNDKDSMPGNTKNRNNNSKTIKVNTISLNDLINIKFNKKTPLYISIDTEGSEYEIIKSFDFNNYRPQVFTIEHNHTIFEKKIDDVLKLHNYKRIFEKLTAFDGWYVSEEALNNI